MTARLLGPTGFAHATAVYTILMLLSSITLSFQVVCAKYVAKSATEEERSNVFATFCRCWEIRPLALALACAEVFVLANVFPLVCLSVQGDTFSTTMPRAAWVLYQHDMAPLAVLVFVTTLLITINSVLRPLSRFIDRRSLAVVDTHTLYRLRVSCDSDYEAKAEHRMGKMCI